MPRYYHCTYPFFAEDVLRDGIKPGLAVGVQGMFEGKPADSSYLYLMKNLDCLCGEYCPGLVKDGMVFFSVDVPDSHPITRDLDARLILQDKPDFLIPLMNLFEIDFAPTDYVGEEEMRRLVQSVMCLDQSEREMALVKKINKALVSNPETVRAILRMPTVEKWDEVLGFYRTRRPIPPRGGGYRIELYTG